MTNIDNKNGDVFTSQTTPTTNKTLFNAVIGPKKIIPVIFIPGIMGTNLESNGGDEVWFPPNNTRQKIGELLSRIFLYSPAKRQTELNPATTRVSNSGYMELDKTLLPKFTEAKARERGWGTLYWDGYGQILMHMEAYLNDMMAGNMSFHQDTDVNEFFGAEVWRAFTDIPQKDKPKAENPFKAPKVDIESTLFPDDKGSKKIPLLRGSWSPSKEFKLLTVTEFKKIANYAFPVFGLGYNWLQDNSLSAKDVIRRLDNEVQAQIKKEFPKGTFEKYIIVTHSMGGLVTRAMITDESFNSKVLGVVHGVMPASGAPTVYKRFANGWDGNEVTDNFQDYFAQVIFGATAKSLTPVLGNSPGAMALLPFSNFKNTNNSPTWLKLRAKKLDGSLIEAKLPSNPEDVFNEVYRDTGAWWRMVNKNFLDPAEIIRKELSPKKVGENIAGVAGAVIGSIAGGIANKIDGAKELSNSEEVNLTSIIDFYLKNISMVETSQDKIKDSYHDVTYAHYGNDQKFKAFHEVIWETDQKIDVIDEDELINYTGVDVDRNFKSTFDPVTQTKSLPPIELYPKWDDELFSKNGERRIQRKNGKDIVFKLHVAPTVDGSGDGTVCHQSACDVNREKVKQVFVINGYDHANSYKDVKVQSNVLYCIGKIVQEIES